MSIFKHKNRPQTQGFAVAHDGLSSVCIYMIFVLWTLFSVFVYGHFSQLGDSESYLSGAYDDSGQARTLLITLISTKLISLLRNETLVHITFSLFAATGVLNLVKHARLRGRYRWPLLAIILNPNFGVWASVIGRESLFIGLLGFFMGAVLGYHRRRNFWQFVIALACLAGMIFIRSAYGAGLAFFFVMFLAYTSGVRIKLSVGVQGLLFAMFTLLLLIFLWPYLDNYINNDVLPKAKSYFTVGSATTRTWITMGTTRDLLVNLWWSLPLALIGPTLSEVATRPIILPFLASGIAVFAITIYSICIAFRSSASRSVRKILLLGWLPAILLIIVSYVPFGIYNPGSGIRYSSCFLLFLIFPSMLYSATSAKAIETSQNMP